MRTPDDILVSAFIVMGTVGVAAEKRHRQAILASDAVHDSAPVVTLAPPQAPINTQVRHEGRVKRQRAKAALTMETRQR
jgi:hypothetical protein